ncbi:MAG: ribokinase [Planctomycetes bacterium]|nr:ribokinase [Planctomycetota bacterium]
MTTASGERTSPALCVVGSINMDLVVGTPRLPERGETVLGGPFATHPGGKGANQAVAAARLGARVAMVGRVGDDDFGRQLTAGLRADGVDVEHVRTAPGVATGIAAITVEHGGENTIVVAPGANARLTVDDVAAARAVLEAAAAVVLQLEVPLPTVAAAVAHARAAGVRVILNAAPAARLPPDLLPQVDVLVVNRGEGRLLAGSAAPGDDDTSLCRALRALGPRLVVLTRGAEGALALGPDGAVSQPAFAVATVDTVAAGDAFVGALAVGLAADTALAPALRFACAAGALATTRHGAQPSLPTTAAMEAFLAAS